jgi:hypothetical protein
VTAPRADGFTCQGWGPLCAFLGVPVPEGKPFPHLNDAAEFRARIERATRMLRRTIGYTAALVLIIIALVVIWLAQSGNGTQFYAPAALPITACLRFGGPGVARARFFRKN